MAAMWAVWMGEVRVDRMAATRVLTEDDNLDGLLVEAMVEHLVELSDESKALKTVVRLVDSLVEMKVA